MSKPDKKTKSLDETYQELQKIVTEFEQGDVPLELAVNKFEEGLKLASFLKTKLNKVQTQIEEIKVKFEEP